MAEYTTNYNLEKQQGNDNVNIDGINNNFDVIDAEIKKAQDKADQAFQFANDTIDVHNTDTDSHLDIRKQIENLGAEKVDKVSGKGLSTNDYTSDEKNKLTGIEKNANKYVHPGSGTNPHGTTKSDIGLSNVDNVKQMPMSGGTFTGMVTAHSNTSYTVRQIRNIVLSTANADVNSMQDGDIWIKYE